MIGPLAFHPCGGFATYGMSCARPCALLRSPAFLMPLDDALKIWSAPKIWLKGRFLFTNPHIPTNYLNHLTTNVVISRPFEKYKWTYMSIFLTILPEWSAEISGFHQQLAQGTPMDWIFKACKASSCSPRRGGRQPFRGGIGIWAVCVS